MRDCEITVLVVGLLAGMAVLTGCASAAATETKMCATSPKSPYVVPSQCAWHSTGYALKKGLCYRLTSRVTDGETYRDLLMPCTPDGPASFLGRLFDAAARDARPWWNPVHWLGPGRVKRLRVLTDRTGRRASFLTLIAAIGYDDTESNVYVVGSEREFTAHESGELVLFSNDWPGGPGVSGEERFRNSKSYANNRGSLTVNIRALP